MSQGERVTMTSPSVFTQILSDSIPEAAKAQHAPQASWITGSLVQEGHYSRESKQSGIQESVSLLLSLSVDFYFIKYSYIQFFHSPSTLFSVGMIYSNTLWIFLTAGRKQLVQVSLFNESRPPSLVWNCSRLISLNLLRCTSFGVHVGDLLRISSYNSCRTIFLAPQLEQVGYPRRDMTIPETNRSL